MQQGGAGGMVRTFYILNGGKTMSTSCEICGKGASTGARIVRHGLCKKKGGIGLHTTAVTKRTFKPNLQTVRASVNGGVKRMTVCTSCLKAGKVTKA